MSRFRKLNLDEAREAFDLINERTRKSLKGGIGISSSGILEQENDLGLQSFNRFADLSQDDPLKVSVMSASSSGCCDNEPHTYLENCDFVGHLPDYGAYCMTHHIYFPRNKDCYECSYYDHDNDNYGNNYYGDSYYSGENYGGNDGGTWFPGGGGGVAGTGGNNSSSSDGIKFVYPEGNQKKETCVTMCITQTLLTYGFDKKDVSLEIVLDKAAKAIYDNPSKCSVEYAEMSLKDIRYDLEHKGIGGIEIPVVLKAFFDVSEIKKAPPRTPEASDPESSSSTEAAANCVSEAIKHDRVVIGYFPQGDGAHCVAITKIDGNMCTYYDPMDVVGSQRGEKTLNLSYTDMKLYEVRKK